METEHEHEHAKHEHGHEKHDHDDGKHDCCDGHGHAHDDHGHGHADAHAHGHDEHPAEAAEEEEDAPLPPLNWKYVSYIYAGGCVLCAIFGGLHVYGVEQVKGFWLIFALFPPCLLYSLYKYSQQRALAIAETSEAKKKD